MSVNKNFNKDKILEEYKNFLRIISHDFNAPLRHLEEFTKLLIQSVGANIGEEEEKYIFFINQSLKRLNRMQHALLLSSRVYTQNVECQKINTDNLIKEILVELEDHFTPKTEVTYHNLLDIDGDKSQLKMVFKILIKNALQYHEDREGLISIEISSQKANRQIIFKIQDNGLGIAPEHYEGIFNMFRRLHAEDSYGGGIGAGLTIAKSIIERHGGTIWLDSELYTGSCFYFCLPIEA